MGCMAEDDAGAAPKAETSIRAKTPSDFLQSIKGKPVLVKLNSGVDYRGACLNPSPPPLPRQKYRRRCLRIRHRYVWRRCASARRLSALIYEASLAHGSRPSDNVSHTQAR